MANGLARLFGRKKPLPLQWDPENQEPAVRSSICTGERSAGFLDKKSGHFTEIALIRSDEELEEFMARCGVTGPLKKIY